MIYEQLSEKDIAMIDDFVHWNGANPDSIVYGTIVEPKVYLSHWDQAKSQYLYRLMGEQLIIEREVSYKEPIARQVRIIEDSLRSGALRSFYRQMKELCETYLCPDYFCNEAHALRELFNASTLARNAVQYLWDDKAVSINLNDEHTLKIQEGMKPMKALKKLAAHFHLEDEFEQFRLAHSQILNQKAITGTLCLSIHPMDYMTMSENSSGWTSCMNWSEPGGYRAGTIEMMNSPMVVVAYLKSNDKDYVCGSHKWSNKKWRSLFVVNPQGIVSVKGYPYEHKELAITCINILSDLAQKNLQWSMYPVEEIKEDEHFIYPPNNREYHITTETSQMYNDFGCATHWGSLTTDIDIEENEPIHYHWFYSGAMTCMCCGKKQFEFYDESYVFCESCCSFGDDEYDECCHCGGRWSRDEMYWIDDSCYCPDCISDVGAVDIASGEYFYYDDLRPVYLASKKDAPSEQDQLVYVHEEVWDETNKRFKLNYYLSSSFVIAIPRYSEEHDLYYVNREDVLERGLRVFDVWDADRYFQD